MKENAKSLLTSLRTRALRESIAVLHQIFVIHFSCIHPGLIPFERSSLSPHIQSSVYLQLIKPPSRSQIISLLRRPRDSRLSHRLSRSGSNKSAHTHNRHHEKYISRRRWGFFAWKPLQAAAGNCIERRGENKGAEASSCRKIYSKGSFYARVFRGKVRLLCVWTCFLDFSLMPLFRQKEVLLMCKCNHRCCCCFPLLASAFATSQTGLLLG